MLKIICICALLCNFLFLSYSSPLAAQDNEVPVQKPRQYSAGRVDAKKDETISSGSSKAHRKNKNGYNLLVSGSTVSALFFSRFAI